MTATAKRARKSIKEDQLVTAAVRTSEWAQEHFNQVVIGVVALVAAVAVVVFVANSRQNNARQAERQMGTALALMQQGEVSSARASFEQIIQRHGGHQALTARFFKAECEVLLGNYDQAIVDYDAYLARRGDYPVFAAAAAIGRGLAYEGAGQWAQAAEAMTAALELLERDDPRYFDTVFHAASFHERAGNRMEAVRYYEMAAEGAAGELRDRAAVAAAALK